MERRVEMRDGFTMRSPEEVEEALRKYVARCDEEFDEEFGLMAGPAQERWKKRLGPPATERGYHGTSQGSSYYALSLLRLGEKVERARKVYSRVLEAQVTDKSSRRYGEFKLIYEALDDDVLDGNTTFFISLALITAVREYADLLGGELVDRIKCALALIPPKTYERDLGVSYTNATVGDLAICLAICDMVGDRERFEVSRRRLDYFYEMHMSRGIPERNSRTYYMVDLVSLGLILTYVSDEHTRVRARELLSIFLQEFLFFEDRQAIPARRTYNQDVGAALSHNAPAWVLGAVEGDGEMEENGWIALCELTLRRVVDPDLFALPAPRQMRGRFVDSAGYTSYFHKDYTLGTFDHWPPLTVGKQHESDIPVAFAGARSNLVYFGAYSRDTEGNIQRHPGTGKVGMPSRTVLPRLAYAASQHANVCVLLTNITRMATEMTEYGWVLRGLQYDGKLYDADGAELAGTGTVDAQWVFLATDEYYAGVYPLTHFDLTTRDYLACTPTSLRYEFGEEKGLEIFAPNFRTEEPIDVKGNNIPAGAVLVLGSAKETELDVFRAACLAATIVDEWYVDGWNVRAGYRDCERRVGIRAPGAELRLAFDYLENKVVSRSFNGRELVTPTEISAVRLGVMPWVCAPGR